MFFQVLCSSFGGYLPLAGIIKSAMKDIELDVDMALFEEEEEQLMLEAEIEHLQREAEIALNTRMHEGALLPFFSHNLNDHFYDSTTDSSRSGTREGTVENDVTQKEGGLAVDNFAVMAKSLLRTLDSAALSDIDNNPGNTLNRTDVLP